MQEFRAKCRTSQDLICSTIPWASAEADKAVARGGNPPEERLLAELLVANEELLDALKMYDDLEKVGVEQKEFERKQAEFKVCQTSRDSQLLLSFSPATRFGRDIVLHADTR